VGPPRASSSMPESECCRGQELRRIALANDSSTGRPGLSFAACVRTDAFRQLGLNWPRRKNDNDFMDYFNGDRLQDALDFFILKRFGDDGPLTILEIQRRVKQIHALLDLFARRKGKQSLESLPATLQRLQREGWLKAEKPLDDGPESKVVYSLTAIGEQRLKEELARQQSMLSQFIEEADLDRSFRKFLDRGGALYGN